MLKGEKEEAKRYKKEDERISKKTSFIAFLST